MAFIKTGDRYRVTRITQPDPDSYAVIYYGPGFAFGCGKHWFETQKPEVGDDVVMGTDGRWRIEKKP